MFKIFKNTVIGLAFASSSAYAANCHLASPVNSVIDLRDGGIGFAVDSSATIANPDAVTGGECKTQLRATNLDAPRSKILQDFIEAGSLQSFSHTIEISKVSLQGNGGMRFMHIDFNYSYPSYLDLYIYPGPIAQGSTEASTYQIIGSWNSVGPDGVALPANYIYSGWLPVYTTETPNVILNWQYINYGLWDGMRLDLNIGKNIVLPISVYPPPDTQAGMPWGQQKFYPTTYIIGSLSKTDLVPQSSFFLKATSVCSRSNGVTTTVGNCFSFP